MLGAVPATIAQVAVVNAVAVIIARVAVVNAVLVTIVAAANSNTELANGLLHFEKAGKHLFFAPEIPDWLVVNQNSAYLLFSCDGARTEDQILDSVGLRGDLRQDGRKLFEEARGHGILKAGVPATTTAECPDGRLPSPGETGKSPSVLRSIYLKLTNECNLRCKYCYAGSGKPSEVLSNDALKRILNEASEISPVVEYVLTGGEPLLHPYALDFAEEAFSAGNAVHILTNGALVNEDMARRIAKATNLVKISIDGTTEAIHSISRGKGNFDQIIRGVELLIEQGANVQVAMTVTKKNVHDLANMSARWGSRLTLQPLFKAGRGKGKSNIALTGEEYYRAMDEVENIAPMGNIVSMLEGLRGRGVKKCALADREISISETGDVYPCQLLHAPEFLAGNIHTDSLPNIYFKSPVLDRVRKVNVDTIEECSQCPIRLICAGGCRARDYYESGSIETVGEFCEYEKLAFINGLLDYSKID
jgi:radical SAM protein with 4Fe4S-binding SPASM domain